MLIEFSVGNYRSFKDIVTFSMVASKLKEKDERLNENNVFEARKNLRLLTGAAVYGANASGKSNLAKAMAFMIKFMITSSTETQSQEAIDTEPFRLSSDTPSLPSYFEIVFMAGEIQYRYGFEVTYEDVVSEWLYAVPHVREICLFERREGKIKVSKNFKEGKGLESKTRSNALFLSVAGQFNGDIAQRILATCDEISIVSGVYDSGSRVVTLKQFQDSDSKRELIQFIKNLDVGIVDVEVGERLVVPENLPRNTRLALLAGQTKVVVSRRVTEKDRKPKIVKFDLNTHESEGTNKLFSLAGPLWLTLKKGTLLVVDEMDARLHPIMTREIIGLFNSKEFNPNHAQLIVMTHDTNLLQDKLYRRDQIWFTEKNRQGATDLYSLAEYKSEENVKVRNDASWEKDYIRGRYGAIPYLGNLSSIWGNR